MKFNSIVFDGKALCFIVLFLCQYFFCIGQTISTPNFSGTRCYVDPNSPPPKSTVTTSITSPGFPASTVFELLLSDKEGGFVSGTIVIATTTASGLSLTFDNFDFPQIDGTGETLGSDEYRLRIRTSDDSDRSGRSSEISAYYFDGITPEINPNGTVCEIPDALTAQSIFDEYRWYKDDVEIPGQIGQVLPISSTGVYYYRPYLGDGCTTFSAKTKSNQVTVLEAEPIPVSISIAGTTSMCANEQRVLTSSNSDANIVHQWTQDGVLIPGANSITYTVTGIESEGVYIDQVYDSTLSIGDRCTSSSNSININLLNPSIELISATVVFLIPGAQQILEVETQGESQLITWIRNGVDIPDTNTNTLQVDTPGIYTARLEATSSCIDNNGPFVTEESVSVQSPDSITVTIDYDNPEYEDCELDQVLLEATEIRVGSGGQDVVIAESSYAALDMEWVYGGEAIGDTDASTLIDSPSGNGSYLLRITYNGVNFDSNALPVVLNAGSFEIQKSTEVFTIGENMNLFIELPEGAIESNYKFQWLANGNELSGETESLITISDTGSYSVLIEYDSCPEVETEPVIINTGSLVVPSVITPNGDLVNDDWILPADYNQKEDIEINIYASNGALDYSTTNYDGEWPQESNSKAVGTVYYYVINKDNTPIEQGSITIIR